MGNKINTIIELLHKEYPQADISLDFDNTYQLIVATILSAQSTDEMVNSVTPELFDRFPDTKSLANASPDHVVPYIKSIGLYNNKSKWLVNMANQVEDDFGGEIPGNMKGLTSLSGVGRKTANVVLGHGFGIDDSGITVDTHVKRLSNRIGLTEKSSARKIEQDLMEIVPQSEWVEFTHLFISHGREVCDARKPRCDNCIISEYCDSAYEFDHFD